MLLACFGANSNLSAHWKHAKGMSLRYGVIVLENLIRFFIKKSCYHHGFFAVKRRAVFILGATWKALVRGWRRDCVVGGMETRFQWRKAHSRTAKCEAFHVAPRLFFRFLFLIPFTIRQQCTIYPPVIFHWTDLGVDFFGALGTARSTRIFLWGFFGGFFFWGRLSENLR